MIRNAFESRTWRAGLMAGVLALLLPSLVSAQSADEKYRQNQRRNSPFNIGSSPTALLQANKFQCGLQSNGQICTDVFDSPTGGGGFWPTGTPDQYMFRSGVQIFGVIPANLNFPWAGDTVGAFFNEGTGSRSHGTPLTEYYLSTNAEDLENWPDVGTFAPNWPDATAYVTDTNLFNDVLIGRKNASQEDSWVMYWDGDPGPTNGRDHPMGVVIEQRSLAWNYPDGNENIIYFIYKFTNVTNHPLFQRLNEEKFFGGQNVLPDEGWSFDEIYVASDSDPDVTADFSKNYATGVLPFNLGLSYEGTFFEPAFDYPPSEFFPPFFVDAPGFVGVKYLKSPIDPATGEEVGLTSFSLHTNGGPFPDPSSVQRGWRYVSLNVDAGKGDPDCTFAIDEVKARRSCFLNQQQSDVRFFIGSGPFSLGPGESVTIAKAMYAAAVVATPLITRGASADNKPGFPSIHPGCFGDPIRPIDVAVGWVTTDLCPTDPADAVNQHDVTVVPKSLLGRALVAQSIFDNKFLLGFSPEPPNFYLVPGDNQITVVWEQTPTEQTGDPFFAAAGDPENALYDPNYREFDVEGYRIYRGTSPGNLQLVAQFDKTGSVFTDNICITDPTYVTGDPCEDVHEIDLTGNFVQYPPGGVVRLADGTTLVINADTAVASAIAAGNGLALSNNGIPFAYVDTDVRNGFQYFYRVTAFDLNSLRSGPTSLESAGAAKPSTPRRPASSLTDANFSFGLFGRGSEPLSGPSMSIDPATGIFAGKAPPTDLLSGDFIPFAPQLLPTGTYQVRIDSVVPYYYEGEYFLTVTGEDGPVSFYVLNNEGDGLDLPVISVPSDPTIRQQLISQGVEAPPVAGSMTSHIGIELFHFHSNDNDWAFEVPGFWNVDPPNTLDGGSRWYSGENESMPNPTAGKENHGALDGISTIFKPLPYIGMSSYNGLSSDLMRRFYQTSWAVRRAADMRIYWGASGPDSVIDLTHDVTVPFSSDMRASYGFLTDADENGTITYGDFYHIPHLCTGGTPNIGNTACNDPDPLVAQPVVAAVDATGDLEPDGTGFGLYIAGEAFLFVGTVPTSGTWTLRTYSGSVTHGNTYAFEASGATPGVPGLSLKLDVQSPAAVDVTVTDLALVHTVPDPFYGVSQFDLSPASKELQFVNLPARATIRIYSMSGVLVDVVNHDDPAGGGRAPWDLRNRSNQFVASGVYFYHVSTPDGKSRVGKFTVVNSGFAR